VAPRGELVISASYSQLITIRASTSTMTQPMRKAVSSPSSGTSFRATVAVKTPTRTAAAIVTMRPSIQ
jgi:hypothetical protein